MKSALRQRVPATSPVPALAPTGILVFVLALAPVMLPGGLPPGVLARGLVSGCSTALLAAGLVLVYRSARIVNFAQAALGGAAAYLCFALVEFVGVPFVVALPVALLGGALTGLLVDAIFVQRFLNSPRLILTVVTIVLSRFLGDSRRFVDALPGIGSAARSLRGIEALQDGRMRLPFRSLAFDVHPFTFGFAAIATVVMTATALGGLLAFLRSSRLGTAVRGAAVNAERASSLGINVRLVSSVVWSLAGLLSGLAALTVMMNSGFGIESYGPELLIPALAAAVLARMERIPVAVVSALLLSVVDGALSWSNADDALLPLGYLLLIAAALLVQRRARTRSEAHDAVSWQAVREIRPVPKELEGLTEVRRTRRILAGSAAVFLAVLPFVTSNAQTALISLVFIHAIVALSLVVLTGWAGQVSLGQFGLVAMAAVAGGHLTSHVGLSFWVTLPVVAALTGGVAAVLGVPALRVRGPFLAVSTIAFAVATHAVVFETDLFASLLSDRVYRPRFAFVSFASERNFYFLALFFAGLSALTVGRLRRSRPGRLLVALRDNEAGVESFGVPALRTRLAAFSLAGALCGIAGVLFVHHQRAVDAVSFAPVASIDIFVMTMIGGVTSVSGALLGAAYVGAADFVITNQVFRNMVTSGGLLTLLFVAPGGLAGLLASVRDGALRIVATRRQIVVPSLFADLDAEVLAGRRAPLATPIPYRGLEAIPRERRYARSSELHGRPGPRAAEVRAR